MDSIGRFEMLDFKNDVAHWRKKDELTGATQQSAFGQEFELDYVSTKTSRTCQHHSRSCLPIHGPYSPSKGCQDQEKPFSVNVLVNYFNPSRKSSKRRTVVMPNVSSRSCFGTGGAGWCCYSGGIIGSSDMEYRTGMF